MTRLNREAAEALHEISAAISDGEGPPVHAVTDVTGFGMLGHAREMAIGSGVSMQIDCALIAYLPGAVEALRGKNFSGGLANNREFLEGCVTFDSAVPDEFRALFFDPQTSGGLLASVAPEVWRPRALAAFETARNIPSRESSVKWFRSNRR